MCGLCGSSRLYLMVLYSIVMFARPTLLLIQVNGVLF